MIARQAGVTFPAVISSRQSACATDWNLEEIASRPTSQTCPCCGHVSKENRRTQARFECLDCGYENNADVVGAINVLERGHRLLACGETVKSGRSVKQEPAEATTQELALV